MNLQMGNSLAKERMLEKAEQVREALLHPIIVPTKIIGPTKNNWTNQKDRLEKMNTKQRPGTPLVRYLALRMFLMLLTKERPWPTAQGALLDHRHHGGGASRKD